MASHHITGNTARDTSIQINNVQGSVNLDYPKLLPSFFKTSNYESYKNNNPKRANGTCMWFLQHPIFQEWNQSHSNSLLWVSADPGCGKSVLSRALIDERLASVEHDTLCYFFFKDNEEQNNVATALCALLHQLFCKHKDLLPKYVTRAYNECGKSLKKEFESLWRIFLSAVADSSVDVVVCILDALDECQENDRNKLIEHLEHFYLHSASTSRRESKLKFIVTSRPYSSIERKFSNLTHSISTIRLAGENESEKISKEIEIVIEVKTKEITKRCMLKDKLHSALVNRLREIPNRTYLWLHLTLDEVESRIERAKTKKNLNTIIGNLSSTVEEAYESILKHCNSEEARKTLQIIVAARRPLTVDELDVALEIRSNTKSYQDLDEDLQHGERWKSIRHNCGLFVNIVDSRVFLIHQTARDFLVRSGNIPTPQSWRYSIDVQEAHRVLAEICVTHILFREFQEYTKPEEHDEIYWQRVEMDKERLFYSVHNRYGKSNLTKTTGLEACTLTELSHTYAVVEGLVTQHAFLGYSTNHWIAHVQEARNIDQEWIVRIAKVCNIRYPFSAVWPNIRANIDFFRDIPDEPHICSLCWATKFGLPAVLRYLLRVPSDISLQEANIQQLLWIAARHKLKAKELVEVILQWQGTEVDIQEDVITAAVRNSSCGKDVIKLLTQQRVDKMMISEAIVIGSYQNSDCGKAIMLILIEHQADRFPSPVVLLTWVAQLFDREVLAFLFAKLGNKAKVTKDVIEGVRKNWRHGKSLMIFLLEEHSGDLEISSEVVAYIAQHFDKEVMLSLLFRLGNKVEITEEVVVGAKGNYKHGKDIMMFLLRQHLSKITLSVKFIVCTTEYFDQEVLASLLSEQVEITEEVFIAATRNEHFNEDMMMFFDKWFGDRLEFTEEMFIAAARNIHFNEDVLMFFAKRFGERFEFTEEAAKEVIKSYARSGKTKVTFPEQWRNPLQRALDMMGSDVEQTNTMIRCRFLDRWVEHPGWNYIRFKNPA